MASDIFVGLPLTIARPLGFAVPDAVAQLAHAEDERLGLAWRRPRYCNPVCWITNSAC